MAKLRGYIRQIGSSYFIWQVPFSLGGRLSHAAGHSKGYVPHKIIA